MKPFEFIKNLFWRKIPSKQYQAIKRVSSITDVPEDPGATIFIVGSEITDKWVVFKCPDNCGRRVEVNLMKSRYPNWRLKIKNKKVSLWPSVIVDGCGSHFWMQNSEIELAKDDL
ncbi:MAG: hypothetical protein JST50_09920 [Bacteroidetes bacterium]|jgi:hypothetical protein|nr:hypothetical protein [Bacteroidota bacterium]